MFLAVPHWETGVGWADVGVPQSREEYVPQLAELWEEVCSSMPCSAPGARRRDRSCSIHWRIILSVLEGGLQCTRMFHSAHCKCTFQFGIARDV